MEDWVVGSHCAVCGRRFGMFALGKVRVRHSCKTCGESFCRKCGTVKHSPWIPCGFRCECSTCSGVAARLRLSELSDTAPTG